MFSTRDSGAVSHADRQSLERERRSICSSEREDDLSLTENNVRDDPAPQRRTSTVAWIFLVAAGLLEVIWAFFMKKSAGFTLPVPSAITLMTMIASFVLLSVSMKTLPLGTAYTVWTGIGAVGAFLVGIAVLGEAVTPMRLLAAVFILAGIVMMKLSSAH
jgi:quaternary ammonium compound-resistance protein SugE